MTPDQNSTPVQITRTPLESKLLASAGYDAASQTLEVEFAKSGAVYRYFGVPPQLAQEMLAADSVGGHFLRAVKDNFAFTRMDS